METSEIPIDWEAIYWQQMPRLYNYFRYRTGDGTTAQDLTANTLERAWRYRERYRSDLGAFEAWLFSIARHVAADYLQSHEGRAPDAPLDDAEDIAADEDSVERSIELLEDAEHLYALLSHLPEAHQELIALKYGADHTNRAIARITGMSESNVGSTLHRVLKRLREQWLKTETHQ
jgi:RNA polymerase sigma-70 factor (ECF subfamily)